MCVATKGQSHARRAERVPVHHSADKSQPVHSDHVGPMDFISTGGPRWLLNSVDNYVESHGRRPREERMLLGGTTETQRYRTLSGPGAGAGSKCTGDGVKGRSVMRGRS